MRFRILLAFAAVYTIWGSTYLGMKIAIETLPPFLMAGFRFVIAGLVLYLAVRAAGSAPPPAREWRSALIVGAFLLLGGNGGVVWAQQRVPSGTSALFIASVPMWAVLIDWLRPGGARPSAAVFLGLIAGFAGVFALIGPHFDGVDPAGALVLILAALSWAAGSIYLRAAGPGPLPILQSTAMQMIVGGSLLLAAGAAAGEIPKVNPEAVSTRSAIALAYLILFGSLAGFSAYAYLLKVTTPARATTYAFVNPLVAVFLGWSLAGEPVTARTLAAAGIIVGGVVLIAAARRPAHGSLPSAARKHPTEGRLS